MSDHFGREIVAYRDLLARMVAVLKARHTVRDSALAGAAQATLDQFERDELVDLPPGPPAPVRFTITDGIFSRKERA